MAGLHHQTAAYKVLQCTPMCYILPALEIFPVKKYSSIAECIVVFTVVMMYMAGFGLQHSMME